jgi:hypothetical protein
MFVHGSHGQGRQRQGAQAKTKSCKSLLHTASIDKNSLADNARDTAQLTNGNARLPDGDKKTPLCRGVGTGLGVCQAYML